METRARVLVVDDKENILKLFARLLEDTHDVTCAGDGARALALLGTQEFDLVVTDVRMPGADGFEVLRTVKARHPDTEVVMMTGYATVTDAVEAMRAGAYDYLQKPFQPDAATEVVGRALERRRLRLQAEALAPTPRAATLELPGGVVGHSPAMEEVHRLIAQAARLDITVLITGETGTGKEMVARLIHHRSAQRDMPLIKVNCAAIPETLLESELFGHVRGAFTGATMTKRGKFALADGGSIFLDEIGTMTPAIQSKLLRVLQEREFEPLGAERTQKVDVRVIAATNRDLKQMVSDGKFQEDLYYRLNVIPVEIPPLRERREDIPVLMEHFVEKHRQRTGKRIDGVDEGVAETLQRYDWPGNVRELENTIERAVVLTTGPILTTASVSMIGATSAPPPGLPSLRLHQNLEWVERETIRRALEQSGGIKKDAAEQMGISQRALSYYLAKYRID